MSGAKLKRLILQKLIRANIWGKKHTPLDFIKKAYQNVTEIHTKERKLWKIL